MIDMATVTGVSIEAWKCNLLPFLEIMIERPTGRLTATLPITTTIIATTATVINNNE